MKIVRAQNAAELKRLLARLASAARPSRQDEATVARILKDVRLKGDKALLAHVRRWDGFKARGAADLRVSPSDIQAAYSKVSRSFQRAAEAVRSNIEAFQKRLKASSWKRQLRPGVTLGQSVRPIRRVGLYVPGGAAPLASTLLMSAVPAKVAGVRDIALCTPNRGLGVDPRILVAADIAGISEIWQAGGAQAIAALAYGTRTIAKVDKIAGPGNRFVNLAKKAVYGEVGIDSLAGPSEAMILADDSADPRLVAADLLSQAEHTGDETAVLVTPSERLAKAALKELALQLKRLPRQAAASASLKRHGLVVLVKNVWAGLEVVNARGPEHLQLMLRGAEAILPKVRAAGAIFVGTHTPVAMGDFVAGPSHILPTGATARFMSGLSAEDFVTKSSIISYSREALKSEAWMGLEFAAAEGLEAHGRSISLRTGKP